MTQSGNGVSSNWAGYVVTSQPAPGSSGTVPGGTFTDVAGTWIQPNATCDTGESTSSAFWVGLGGVDQSSGGLEQIGTEADCAQSGRTTYSAWYELLPADPVQLKLRIRPGDKVRGAVLAVGRQVVLSLNDLTRHTRSSTRIPLVDPLDLGSAEWIAEAPSLCSSSGRCQVVPLTNFGTMTFNGAAAIENGHPGTISDTAWSAEQVTLVPDGSGQVGVGSQTNTHGALPSTLSADGRSFSVAWQESTSAPPSP